MGAQGLMSSITTVCSTLVTMILLLYLFALVGVEIISKDEELLENTKSGQYFGSLASTMITLFQFVTLDSVASVYRPLVEEKPYLLIYFIALVVLISITLLNLVTAVTVEVALDMSRNDQELRVADMKEKRSELVPI